jgi:RNA polymerase sigma-70 factor, ECF subfamily
MAVLPAEAGSLDVDSPDWPRSLRSAGRSGEEAAARLHALLLRAARFEVARRRPSLQHLREDELDDIALEAADAALVGVLRRLDDFRGDSRFSTWASKFALLEAAVRLRTRAWQTRELPVDPEAQSLLPKGLENAIAETLTPHQRRVIVALTLDGVPIDVLAESLGTTRGAVYETLRDARRNLRAQLGEHGLTIA